MAAHCTSGTYGSGPNAALHLPARMQLHTIKNLLKVGVASISITSLHPFQSRDEEFNQKRSHAYFLARSLITHKIKRVLASVTLLHLGSTIL